MILEEIYDLYKTLELYPIKVSEKSGQKYSETHYLFGDYDIMYAKFEIFSDEILIYKDKETKAHILVTFSYESEANQVYDIYQDVKNKADGKPYNSPYKKIINSINTKTLEFEKHLSADYKKLFPNEMSADTCLKIINQLKQAFKDQLFRFYIK